MNLTPCKSCPFRVGNTAADIPGYDQVKAEGLMACCGRNDGFRNIMACHCSAEGKDFACRGYLAQEGDSNLAARLDAIQGNSPWAQQVRDACAAAGIELEPNYATVLVKLSSTHQGGRP